MLHQSIKKFVPYIETIAFCEWKFFKSFEKVESGHKGYWFKYLEDEIWEFRERDSSKFYRISAFNAGQENE